MNSYACVCLITIWNKEVDTHTHTHIKRTNMIFPNLLVVKSQEIISTIKLLKIDMNRERERERERLVICFLLKYFYFN